jgi:flagellar biosynthesis/type III secretory pathway protein FliH
MQPLPQLKNIYDSNFRNKNTYVLTEEQLSDVKEEYRTAGFEAGRNDAVLEASHRKETLQREMLYNLQLSVEKSLEYQSTFQTKVSNLVLNLSIALFKKTFPSYSERAGTEEITSFIGSQLNHLKDLPELLITVHPDRAESTKTACNQIKAEKGLKCQLSVKASPDLEPTDCLIKWESGYVEKKLDNIINDISSFLLEQKKESTIEEEK